MFYLQSYNMLKKKMFFQNQDFDQYEAMKISNISLTIFKTQGSSIIICYHLIP